MELVQDDVRPLMYDYLGDLYPLLDEKNSFVVNRVLRSQYPDLKTKYKGELIPMLIKEGKITKLLQDTRKIDKKYARKIEVAISKYTNLMEKVLRYKKYPQENEELSNEINDIIINNDLVTFSSYLTPDSGSINSWTIRSKEMLRELSNIVFLSDEDIINMYLNFMEEEDREKLLTVISNLDTITFQTVAASITDKETMHIFADMIRYLLIKSDDDLVRIVSENNDPDLVIDLIQYLNFGEKEIDLLSEYVSIHPDVLEYLIDHDLIYEDGQKEGIQLTLPPSQSLMNKIADKGWTSLMSLDVQSDEDHFD